MGSQRGNDGHGHGAGSRIERQAAADRAAESAERTGTVDTPAPDGRATDDAEESPVKAWLVLFGQAIVGLADGIAKIRAAVF